ncbi:MAG: hypothetical protein WD004_08250 [Actinomycetota bacterium]
MLVAFCVAQEKVLELEVDLMMRDLPEPETIRRLRASQRIAREQSRFFFAEDRRREAKLIGSWADSFRVSIRRARLGATGQKTLQPAVLALRRVDRPLSCELDLE